jgi:presequence protease
VEKVIDDTIKEIYNEGIPEDKFEAKLHEIELQVKRTRQHWGLGVISNMLSHTLHDGNPLDVFKLNEYSEKIRIDYKKNLFQKLIEKYFFKNPHKIVLQMLPDKTIADKEKLNEKMMLTTLQKSLKDQDKERLIQEAIELKKEQEQVQDPDQLPGLTLADIPPTIEKIEHNKSKIGVVPVYWFEQPTNGVTHLRIKLNISHLPPHMRELIPTF